MTHNRLPPLRRRYRAGHTTDVFPHNTAAWAATAVTLIIVLTLGRQPGVPTRTP